MQQSICAHIIISLVQIPISGITWPEGRNIFKLLISIVQSLLEGLYQVTHQAAVQESGCFIPWIVIDIHIDMFLPVWSKSGRVTPVFPLFFPLWFSCRETLKIKNTSWLGLPWCAVVENPPANAGDMGSIPGPEYPTCHGATKPVRHNYWACALEPTIHNYWARVPQLLKPTRLERVLHNERSHRNDEPAHCNEE